MKPTSNKTLTQAEIEKLKWNQSTIGGVQLVALETNMDDRGYLVEIVRSTDPYVPKFGQVYLVGNLTRGVVRAFHKHEVLWDYFFISHGSAKFVLVDDRPQSPTYGAVNIFILSTKKHSLLVIPPGVFHGWMSLEDDTQMISTASEVYNRQKPDEVRIAPDSFGDLWTVRGR
ncbi:MAG TPA: dTDP-4-dehydrorhamnose 3,5-epimerase family protein [Elusimicrobiota bacterium]|nr:dTDP-4-dehydrorhamnose 3,5-epimerase family protein [Elusimicrobiota bacterium]